MGFMRDERGITTVGMAVSILVCLSLMFTGAQAYRVQSASAEIQEVADACALAAENEVAEFMIAARLADAAILSMTLLSATTYGIGVVSACIPPLFPMSEKFVEMGSKIASARDRLSQSAADGLNAFQKFLPLLSAVAAGKVAQANSVGAMEGDLMAVAVLCPQEGSPISVGGGSDLAELGEKVEQETPNVRESAQAAEEAAEEATRLKSEAYERDCGAAPGMCQYERAQKLSEISPSDNPMYESVDTWSFSVALARTKAYYAARVNFESEPPGSAKEKASYHLRMRFYKYAAQELEDAYVHETQDSFSAYFPLMFNNMDQFRRTNLYTEKVYPVSVVGSKSVMHAYGGCPAIHSVIGFDSVQSLEAGCYEGCPSCDFSTQSMGKIAAASSSIQNGYEYHYRKIAEAARAYEQVRQEMSRMQEKTKESARPLLEAIGSVIEGIASTRIEAYPPGSAGAIAIVVNRASNPADTGFESMFVRGGATLGIRAAVSGAKLAEDTEHDNASLITSLLDGLSQNSDAATGAARIVLDCWNGLLGVYEKGVEGLTSTLKSTLDSMPLGTLSGLGDWASSALEEVIEGSGLAPANLSALKPLCVNTSRVTDADNSDFSVAFADLKVQTLEASSSYVDLFGGVAAVASDIVREKIESADITIATIEFPIGGLEIPIKLALPDWAKESLSERVGSAIESLGGTLASAWGGTTWQ